MKNYILGTLAALFIGNLALATEIPLISSQQYTSGGQFYISAPTDAECRASLNDLKAKLDRANLAYIVTQITWETTGKLCWAINTVR